MEQAQGFMIYCIVLFIRADGFLFTDVGRVG